ncbi:MAG: hypothetical protein M3X11_02100 [Acidobacteriota bacterium]|nr:hypothetical protein [Acidobacteriota bacterium]
MKLNISPCDWRTAILILSTSLLLSACGEAPKEVSPSQTTAPANGATSQSSPEQSASGVAVGHGSGGVASAPATVPMQSGGGTSASDIKWIAPSRWQNGPEKPMRTATYLIPAAAGDSEGGECAVFLNIGGGVDANIKRWIGQFEQPDGGSSEAKATQKKETVNGLPVTMVDLTGTFVGGGMAMGQPAVKKTNYRLLGAIIEGPNGEVFFKMTGPAKTIAAAQSEFQVLVKSVKK